MENLQGKESRDMGESKKHLILVAGEASGDMHAGRLVEALMAMDPSLTFSGLGGPRMKKSGVEIYRDMTQLAVIGFIEVIRHYAEFKKIFQLILAKIDERRPLAVILVDYPGFNLRLAREIKKRNIRVIYYISPQVWAWGEKRVYNIRKCVDKMLVLFQFEKDFYARFGIDVDWVGHPLADSVQVTQSKKTFLASHGLPTEKLTVGLLPGSRAKEVERLLPVMLEAAGILEREFPQMQFLLLKAPSIAQSLTEDICRRFPCRPRLIEGQTYDGIHACDLCLVASGTATLETAILKKPMVVVYKTSFLTWLLAKFFIKIPDIGLVNVVAGKRIVPECVQFQATGHQIAKALKKIFTNEIRIAEMKTEFEKIREALGETGSIRRAARTILDSCEALPKTP